MFPSSSSLPSEKNSEIEADFKMHPPNLLLDSYNCPVFLRSCNTYREHLLKTEALELKLPPYMINSTGQIVVCHGKVFHHCVPSCGHAPTSTIASLYQYTMRHGLQVATNGSGQLTQVQEDAAIQWYNSTQEAEEDDHDEDDNEDDEEPNYEDDDDEDYEDNDEEDDEDYD
ncbi:uncharacterized protein N7518_006659 [Penicillium psychrosexuale]|uniref:uncharacterized protein n=1 Tax=Penicillium psychrosexuale TaxID=1002107 RepID=UPI0025457DBA|nr:uncharacterized protein N7518_006659 [Penicillium psychrosexuale]KAJ5789648.1 hypothetical protein N7518_006659 [Penicillium psychrosexuale]